MDRVLVTLSLLLLSTGAGWTQVTTATIYGTVADPTGASIPAAIVLITQQETNAAASKVTTETGEGCASNLWERFGQH